MWRSIRLFIPNSKISSQLLCSHGKFYSTSGRPIRGSGKVIFGTIASIGFGLTGAIVYGQYDPKFKNFLENTPYINYIFKMLKDDSAKFAIFPENDLTERKRKTVETVSPDRSNDKIDDKKTAIFQDSKSPVESEPKPSRSEQFSEVKHADDINAIKGESRVAEKKFESSETKDDFSLYENALIETLERLKQVFEEAINAQKFARNAVGFHIEKLHEALDPDSLSSDENRDLLWKEANFVGLEKEKSLKVAKQKAAETKILIQKLKNDVRNLSEQDSGNLLIKKGEDFALKCSEELKNSETEVAAAQKDSKTAFESEHLSKAYQNQLKKEIDLMLPNYLYEGDINNDDKLMTEDDLYLLLSHAHHRIEQLEREIAKQQVMEKIRLEEAMKNQRIEDERKTESKRQTEVQRRLLNLESAVEDRVALARANLEAELHQQMIRQAAVHADHLQEVLKVKEQELERKYTLELEDMLLHQQNVFVSETSENRARLKRIVEYLQAKDELQKSSKRAQALWLASEELNYKMIFDKSGNLNPLEKDIAALKIAAGEDSDFINSILSSIQIQVSSLQPLYLQKL